MGDYGELGVRAQETAREFFRLYFGQKDFLLSSEMLHKDIVWINVSAKKTYHLKAEVSAFLKQRCTLLNETYKIRSQWSESTILDINCCALSCEVELTQWSGAVRREKTLVFSAVCVEEQDTVLFKYVQLSWRKSNIDIDFLPATIMICAYDEKLTLHYVNEGFSVMTGYSRLEMERYCSDQCISFIHPSDLTGVLKSIKLQLKDEKQFAVEYRLVRKDTTVIWVMHRGLLNEHADGKKELRCVLTDVTNQRYQQEELRLSEKRYAIAMENSGISMFEYDIKTKQLYLPMKTAEFYGLPMVVENGVETFISHGAIEPCSAEDYRNMYMQIIGGEPWVRKRIRVRDAKGTKYDYEMSLTCVYDEDGGPIRAIGVRKNMTQIVSLKREQEYGRNLLSDQVLVFEADITHNRMEHIHETWDEGFESLKNMPYSEGIRCIAEKYIVPEHREILFEKMSADFIKEVYEQGENLIAFEYKRKESENSFVWCKATISIVKDSVTDILNIRFYRSDIDEQKLKEQRAVEVRQLYKSITSKAELVYEVNFTQDIMVRGQESWKKLFGIEATKNYTEMMHRFATTVIFRNDSNEFLSSFECENILKAYQKGEYKIACQYRKPDANQQYNWYSCMFHLFEDNETGDVKGFAYIEDIDKQKRLELLLKYKAEHDATTGIFNKSTTESSIIEYLNTPGGKRGYHAFIIIDIDYFKKINDSYGHLFGDEAIKDVAHKIRSLFREYDIVGRIGGDEFCVFMKHASTPQVIESKAKELCDTLNQIYTILGNQCTLSASVGISTYKGDGITFKELYRRADKLLYQAKHEGRNQYMLETN